MVPEYLPYGATYLTPSRKDLPEFILDLSQSEPTCTPTMRIGIDCRTKENTVCSTNCWKVTLGHMAHTLGPGKETQEKAPTPQEAL